jgi:hypothetical protein
MNFTNPADALNKWILSAKPKDIFAHLLMRHAKSFEKFLGLHIIPLHYYSATPTIRELDAKVFDKIYDCPGLDWNLPRQWEYCRDIFPKYHEEYAALSDTSCDSFVLYAMVRERKPKVMVEVGAGGSTKISLAALEKNREEGHDYHLYSVDPYPQEMLRSIRNERHSLLEKKVQDIDPAQLSEADLLFIDSSHVCKIGGDVNFEMLELVPRLKVGALVQWHDIMIPNNYGAEWVEAGLFFNESYLLHAFMLFNSAFKVIWASRYMRIQHPEETRAAFAPLRSPDAESLNVSFWVERVA